MKFIHIADLHIGKRVNGFSMLDDQKYVLKQIEEIVKYEKPDAVLIAGDVYDKQDPSNEAMSLYDSFLYQLASYGIHICIISGNHDSAYLLSCGGRLMEKNKVFVSQVYKGKIEPVVICDDQQMQAKIWLLPFVKPTNVRAHHEDMEIKDYTDAMKCVIDHLEMDETEINIAVAHQFIAGSSVSGSEEASVGGLDNVNVSVFDSFDYVALGHLHGCQKAGREEVRYAGSPLKYSFSEMKQKKSVTIIEIHEKGNVVIRQTPLNARRDFVEIQGNFAQIISDEFMKNYHTEDYFSIILTDEQDIPDAANRLRKFYPNWMTLSYDNTRTRTYEDITGAANVQERSAMDLITELFEKQTGHGFNDFQASYLTQLIQDLEEDN